MSCPWMKDRQRDGVLCLMKTNITNISGLCGLDELMADGDERHDVPLIQLSTHCDMPDSHPDPGPCSNLGPSFLGFPLAAAHPAYK